MSAQSGVFILHDRITHTKLAIPDSRIRNRFNTVGSFLISWGTLSTWCAVCAGMESFYKSVIFSPTNFPTWEKN